MDVILLERVEKLGQIGDVVNVKAGFARNYLLPSKKALRATDANKQIFEDQRADIEARNLERKSEAESVATKLEGESYIIIRQASDMGQLYGSVSSRDVAAAATEGGFHVDRAQVILDKPLKTLGVFDVKVALHPEVIVKITVNIARSEVEAEAQARGENVLAVNDDIPEEDRLEMGGAMEDDDDGDDREAAPAPSEEDDS